MDLGTLKELCQRLDELAAILEMMEGEPIHVDLHREASDNDRHRETSNALGDASATPLMRLPPRTAPAAMAIVESFVAFIILFLLSVRRIRMRRPPYTERLSLDDFSSGESGFK
jgi:hypothetical protein